MKVTTIPQADPRCFCRQVQTAFQAMTRAKRCLKLSSKATGSWRGHVKEVLGIQSGMIFFTRKSLTKSWLLYKARGISFAPFLFQPTWVGVLAALRQEPMASMATNPHTLPMLKKHPILAILVLLVNCRSPNSSLTLGIARSLQRNLSDSQPVATDLIAFREALPARTYLKREVLKLENCESCCYSSEVLRAWLSNSFMIILFHAWSFGHRVGSRYQAVGMNVWFADVPRAGHLTDLEPLITHVTCWIKYQADKPLRAHWSWDGGSLWFILFFHTILICHFQTSGETWNGSV